MGLAVILADLITTWTEVHNSKNVSTNHGNVKFY
jgi:hypothetical protein